MERQTTTIAGWSWLMWALVLTLAIFGWGLLTPSVSESGAFSFEGATVESLGDDLFRVRHVCTSSGIPGVLPPGCYSGAIRVNPSTLTLELVEGSVDTPPSSGSSSGSAELKVEGTITSINEIDAGSGDVTEFTVLGEGGLSGGVRVKVNASTVVVFEKVPPGFGLTRTHLAQGQFVKAEGNPFDTTAGIQATQVEVKEVEVKGPIVGTAIPDTTFNAVTLACRRTIFGSGVQILVPTTFAALCSVPAGTVVKVEGPNVNTNPAVNTLADRILVGQGEEEEED